MKKSFSMKQFVLIPIFLAISSVVISQNILISDQNYPNETCITLDPKSPNILMAGANLNNYYVSTDTGRTWSSHRLFDNILGVWGDPVIDVDTAGHFYYFHLSNPVVGNWIDRIVCHKTTDLGENWEAGTYTGLNGTKAQDKQWSIIDRTNNFIYLTWTQFDEYGSSNSSDSSHILFSKSTDAGASWSTPIRIDQRGGNCIDEDDTVEGAVPALGPDGEVYVAWAGPDGIFFDRSTDQGETWLEEDIFVDSMPGGWAYDIPGIFRGIGLPVTKCDISGGPFDGTIYINWSEQREHEDDTDVWIRKSTDGGNSWSELIRVNDDPPGKHQFFSWMDIDQTNGNIYIVFYDRRAYDDINTDVYLAFSSDGGETFINKKISESPFYPRADVFIGDYNNIVAHNDIVRPIWTRLHNGQLSVWTDLTRVEDFLGAENHNYHHESISINSYPNPASDYSFVSFKLRKKSNVSLILLDESGREIDRILDNEKKEYGKYVERIDLNKYNIQSGKYFYQLFIDNRLITNKLIVMD